MSDYNSSLPVRTETAGDVIAKIADKTTPSQQLAVGSDGSINVTDNGGSLTVDGTVELGTTTLAALESITVQNTGGASAVNIQDGGNSITVDGSVTVSATDLDIRNLSAAQDNVAIRDAGGDELAINTDGSINVVVSNDVSGTEICNPGLSASVGTNTTVNHDYTVTAAKVFSGEQVIASGSGKIKVEVFVNAVSKIVAFNSTANPTVIIPLLRLVKATSGQVVRIAVTNKDNQQQDLYSTLMGEETP